MRKQFFAALSILIIIGSNAYSQTNKSDKVIAFYNLENLFDTINSLNVLDDEFTPEGKKQWNAQKYKSKLKNLSKVLADISASENQTGGPSIIGVCEVENKQVLKDLIAMAPLKSSGYKIIHYNSPDKRGIDVALLYREQDFTPDTSFAKALFICDPINGERIFTRDQLYVSGTLDKEKIHLIVNHWPSRWGGYLASQPKRLAAAQVCRHMIDSVQNSDNLAKIIVMGDFNDDPNNLSISRYLNAGGSVNELKPDQLYNCTAPIFNSGTGSLMYKGEWNLFDQIIVSQALISNNQGWNITKTIVFNQEYLFQQEGKYKGYPLRTFGGRKYLNGYSDHLPSYILLRKL